jgi:cell division protein FtsI/penicillin-binding protein 2
MFERRLKILLALLVCVTAVLVVRAAWVQIVQKEYWRGEALKTLKISQPIETGRGAIVDRWERPIAVDRPCRDVCIDFRALTRDEKDKAAVDAWIDGIAVERVRARLRDAYKDTPRSK